LIALVGVAVGLRRHRLIAAPKAAATQSEPHDSSRDELSDVLGQARRELG
jgi:hypothetical protein